MPRLPPEAAVGKECDLWTLCGTEGVIRSPRCLHDTRCPGGRRYDTRFQESLSSSFARELVDLASTRAARWNRPSPTARRWSSAPNEGARQGKTVLVQMRYTTDPESSQRYTFKRYESEKSGDGDSWQHTKIVLKPVNVDFDPVVLPGADEEQLHMVAEAVEVLGMGT